MTDPLIYDQEAEGVVLGTMFGPLADKTHVAHCLEVLDEADFAVPGHRLVFAAIKRAFIDGEPLDHPLTLVHRLRRDGTLGQLNQDLLGQLLHDAPSKMSARHHLHTVKWASRLREWQAIQNAKVGSEADAERVAAEAHAILTDLKSGKVQLPSPIEAEIKGAVELMEESERSQPGFSSGLSKLDEVTGGFQRGQYAIVGARTSQGKTSLLVQIATHAALSGAKVLFVSLEMPANQVAKRVMAQQANVPVQELTNPSRMSTESWMRIDRHRDSWPSGMWVLDGAFDIDDVVAKVRQAQAQIGPLDVLVVDYIQLVRGRRAENRTQEVGSVSRALKLLANQLGICVLAASQLSRQHEHDKREPRLSDLRESGQLEHDADVIVLIHRPAPESGEAQFSTRIDSELIVAKNRNGRTGKALCVFDAPFNRFEVA